MAALPVAHARSVGGPGYAVVVAEDALPPPPAPIVLSITAPAGARPGMALHVEADGVHHEVVVPAGVGPGEVFTAEVAGATVAVVATAVPSDEELAASLQRAECENAIAALDAARAAAAADLEIGGPVFFGGGRRMLTLSEQKVVNYRWSTKCFAAIDVLDTLLTVLGPVGGAWGPAALVFLLGPLCGFSGAARLDRTRIGLYLGFCCAKTVYVAVLLSVRATSALYVLVFAVQLWVTHIVYTFWRLLRGVPPARCRELADDAAAFRAAGRRPVVY